MLSTTAMEIITLQHTPSLRLVEIPLVSSKSESNRALIIQKLAQEPILLENLSEARDTQTMIRLLASNSLTLDVLDAGTTMRFLTAFCTATNRPTILTGTARMQERPIGILVDALRSLGGKISYVKNDGYPPLNIESFTQTTHTLRIRGDVSSQYISALLMIAPILPDGLTLTLEGEIGSRPYIKMTLSLMEFFGINYTWEGNIIHIASQSYKAASYTIESDWSGASYWYSLVALAESGSLTLRGLRAQSLQGDSAIVDIMDTLGVATHFNEKGAQLTKKDYAQAFTYDFTHCPDLAQTVAVVCAAKNIHAKLTGLQSLRIKETDRITAIQTELQRIGISVNVFGDDTIEILSGNSLHIPTSTVFNTYDDHRMAMAFAPLATLASITIESPDVVNKSYPSFWAHLAMAGITLHKKMR